MHKYDIVIIGDTQHREIEETLKVVEERAEEVGLKMNLEKMLIANNKTQK